MGFAFDGTNREFDRRLRDVEGEVFGPDGSAYQLGNRVADLGVNVKKFGAKGDGIKDDTAAIASAISAAGANALVYFPRGTYLADGVFVDQSGVVLRGASPTASVIKLASSGSKVQFGTGGSYIYAPGATDLLIQGNNIANVGIELNGTSEASFVGVRVDNCAQTSLKLTKSAIDRFENVLLGDAPVNVEVIYGTQPAFNKCNFWNAGTAHIKIAGTSSGLSVVQSWFELSPTAILIENTDREVAIQGGVFAFNSFLFDGGGVDLTSTDRLMRIVSTTVSNRLTVRRMSVTGNRVYFERRPEYAITADFSATHGLSDLSLDVSSNAFVRGPQTAIMDSNTNLLSASFGTNDTAAGTIPDLSGSGTATGIVSSGNYGESVNLMRAPLHYDGADGSVRDIIFSTDGVSRWILRVSNAETGGNAGATLEVIARDDAGNSLGTVMTGYRTSPPRIQYPRIVIGGSGASLISRHMSATATLDLADTASGASSDATITVTGAVAGDTVTLGVSDAVMTGLGAGAFGFYAWVSAADTVTVRFWNASGLNKNPGSGTFRVDVWQH